MDKRTELRRRNKKKRWGIPLVLKCSKNVIYIIIKRGNVKRNHARRDLFSSVIIITIFPSPLVPVRGRRGGVSFPPLFSLLPPFNKAKRNGLLGAFWCSFPSFMGRLLAFVRLTENPQGNAIKLSLSYYFI